MPTVKLFATVLLTLLISFSKISTSCKAQSLEFFINSALENNYKIRIAKNEAKIAATNNTLGNTGILPSLEMDAEVSRSVKNTNLEFSDGSTSEGENAENSNVNAALLANWTLFDGFTVLAKRDKLAELEALGQINARFYMEQTVSDIIMAYYQLIYENGLLKNYEQSLGISAYRLNLEKKKRQMGSGKLIDYGQALVDYQSDSILYLSQQNNIKKLEIELNRLMNNSTDDLEKNLIISDSLTGNPIAFQHKDSLLSTLEMNNLQLGKEQMLELVAESEIRLARSEAYPEINLFAGYQYSKSFAEVGFINSNLTSGPVVGARIRFNLFNAGNTNRNIKNTTVYAENARLSNAQLRLNLYAEGLTLHNQYVSLSERISLAVGNMDAIKKVYNMAAEQLLKGAIDGYNFRLVQLTLLNAELTLMNLQYNLKITEVYLNRILGNVLSAYI